MPIVKNVSSQALYLNLPNGRSLKIPARGQSELEQADLQSPAVLYHLSRGNLAAVGGASPLPSATQLEQTLLSWETWEPEPPVPKPETVKVSGKTAATGRRSPRKGKQTLAAKAPKQKRVKTSPLKKQGEK